MNRATSWSSALSHSITRGLGVAVLLPALLVPGCGPEVPQQKSISEPPVAVARHPAAATKIVQEIGAVLPAGSAGDPLRAYLLLDATPPNQLQPNALPDALNALRSAPLESVRVLQEAYRKLDRPRYSARWNVARTLAALEVPEAAPALAAIASAPVPAAAPPEAEASAREEEVLIRMRATHGLAALARAGCGPAEAALKRLFQHENATVREVAIRGYLKAAPDQQRRERELRSQLPARDLGALSLREAVHPSEVSQPVPSLGKPIRRAVLRIPERP